MNSNDGQMSNINQGHTNDSESTESESKETEAKESESNETEDNKLGTNNSEAKESAINEIEDDDTRTNETDKIWHEDICKEAVLREERLEVVGKKHLLFTKLAVCFGILFTFCFHDFDENFNGVVYPIFVVGLFLFAYLALRGLNKRIVPSSIPCLVAAGLLGISTFLTANPFILMFNTIGIGILFSVFLCKQFYPEREWGFGHYYKVILKIWIGVFPSMKYFIKHHSTTFTKQSEKAGKWKTILAGVGMAIVFLIIVLPLLVSSDLVFRSMMERFTRNISTDGLSHIVRYLLFTIAGAFAFYGLVCVFVSERVHANPSSLKAEQWDASPLLVMTKIIAGVYLVYCGIQVMYLFGGGTFELPVGITYSDYARQGFFQLLFVVVINIALVLILLNLSKESRQLKVSLTIICGCTYIMIASAAYRMILYISAYHLTFQRLLVLWFLAVLSIVMVGILYYIYHLQFRIGRFVFNVVLLLYFALSFMRPDYIIASYNVSHMDTLTVEDVSYLTTLSSDAAPALADITQEQISFNESKVEPVAEDRLASYFDRVYSNYNHGIRFFNLGEYFSYKIVTERLSK